MVTPWVDFNVARLSCGVALLTAYKWLGICLGTSPARSRLSLSFAQPLCFWLSRHAFSLFLTKMDLSGHVVQGMSAHDFSTFKYAERQAVMVRRYKSKVRCEFLLKRCFETVPLIMNKGYQNRWVEREGPVGRLVCFCMYARTAYNAILVYILFVG